MMRSNVILVPSPPLDSEACSVVGSGARAIDLCHHQAPAATSASPPSISPCPSLTIDIIRLFYQTAHCQSTLDILGILNQISIATPLVNRPAVRISRAIIFGYFIRPTTTADSISVLQVLAVIFSVARVFTTCLLNNSPPAGRAISCRVADGRKSTAGNGSIKIQDRLRAGMGIIKVAREVGVGNGTVQRIADEMHRPFVAA
jgi:hypothetical protein